MMLFLKASVVCGLLTTVHGWVSSKSRQQQQQQTRLFMSSSPLLPDLKGKVIYQRMIYKLGSASDVEVHNDFSLEERVAFRPSLEDEGYMESFGRRTLILRGPPSPSGSSSSSSSSNDLFGPELYRQEVHEASHALDGVGNDVGIESAAAMILYLASDPDVLVGNVLDLQCDLGLGGLMGAIAAGFAAKGEDAAAAAPSKDADPLMPHKEFAPLPENMDSLTLVSRNEEMINLAFMNTKYSGMDPAKVNVKEQDWVQRPRSIEKYDKYHVICGNDIYLTFPLSKELARTVAYSLEPDAYKGSAPRFIFVYRDNDDETVYLKKFLREGYLMNLDTGYLKLEKHLLKPAIFPESEPEDHALEKEGVQVASVKGATYECLTALHNAGYDGVNGEYFFPIETGAYEEGTDSTYLEREPRTPW